MSASALPPTAPTTLVIVLGASAWPNSPGFQPSEAFLHAAQKFRDYLLDTHPHGFGLPVANLLDLFDADSGASNQLARLSSFLKERTEILSAANQAVRDVLVSFVGHGGFAGSSHDFYLLPQQADARILRASGISIKALEEVLREKARQMRQYLILDCCFAGAAFRLFQGGPDQAAIAKTLDAFAVQARSRGFPRKGMALLCSSDHKTPSLLLPDESCTMFSYALLKVLKNGDLHRPIQLSLRDIKELAEDQLAALPEQNAPRPSLHSPDQSEGDVADVPFFPNPRAEEELARIAEEERRLQTEETKRRQAEEQARRIEEERIRKATEEEHLRRVEEERRRLAEKAEQARLAEEEHVHTVEEQTSPYAVMPPQSPASLSFTASSQAAILSQSSATLPPLLTPRQPKRLRSPSVVVALIMLTLLLVGGSISVYSAATGKWPWNMPHGQSTYASPNKSVQANANAAATFQANATATARAAATGKIWHAQYSGTSQDLVGVVWSRSQFVAVGESGTILTSPDGRAWTAQNSRTSQWLIGVVWSGSQFVVVGHSGTILTSPDGRAWTAQNSPTSEILDDVVWSGSQFVAVGQSGTILTSP